MAGSIVRPALDPQVVMSDSKYLRARQADGRIRRELEDFRRDPPPGITARPAEGSFRRVYATLQAPEGSPYEGGVFHLTYHYTRGYPNDPPEVKFTTKIFHPNINSKGEISLNILTSDGWSGRLDLAIVLLCIQSILDDPLAEDPLEAEIARLYMSDRVLYNATARDWTIKYAVDNDYCLDDGGTTRSAKRLFPAYLKWDALQEEFEVPFLRVILIGETGVGKTSLVSSLHDEAIPTGRADNSTIGTDINTFLIDGDSGSILHNSHAQGEEGLRERIADILRGSAVLGMRSESVVRMLKRSYDFTNDIRLQQFICLSLSICCAVIQVCAFPTLNTAYIVTLVVLSVIAGVILGAIDTGLADRSQCTSDYADATTINQCAHIRFRKYRAFCISNEAFGASITMITVGGGISLTMAYPAIISAVVAAAGASTDACAILTFGHSVVTSVFFTFVMLRIIPGNFFTTVRDLLAFAAACCATGAVAAGVCAAAAGADASSAAAAAIGAATNFGWICACYICPVISLLGAYSVTIYYRGINGDTVCVHCAPDADLEADIHADLAAHNVAVAASSGDDYLATGVDMASCEESIPPHIIQTIARIVNSPGFIYDVSKTIVRKSFQAICVWDSAGQDAYRLLQYIAFGADRTSYIITFNASRSVEMEVPETTVRRHGEHRQCATAVPGQSSLLYIHDSLQVLNHLVQSSSMRVFIVGTHIDLRHNHGGSCRTLEEEKKVIMDSLHGTPYRHLVSEDDILFVTNTFSGKVWPGDPGLKALRSKLLEESRHQDKIPAARLQEILALQQLSTDSDLPRPWISRRELFQLFCQVGSMRDPGELNSALEFHHGLGTTLFYPTSDVLRDIVIVQVPCVVKLAACLIQPGVELKDFTEDPPTREDLYLHKHGFITVAMAMRLWREYSPPRLYELMKNDEQRKVFLQLMEKLCVLCNVGEIDTVTSSIKEIFLMPAVAELTSIPVLHDVLVSEAILLVTRNADHFPHAIFLLLGVLCITRHNKRLINARMKCSAWRKVALSKHCMRLPWCIERGEWILLTYMKCGIRIQMESIDQSRVFGPGEGTEVLRQIRQWLSDVQATTNLRLELKEAAACGCGSVDNSGALCIVHGHDKCTLRTADSACFHVVEGFHSGTIPWCPVTDTEANISNQLLEFWLSWRQDEHTLLVRTCGQDTISSDQTGFQSISYVRDIHPWLCSLEAVDLRLAVQREGLLTLDQVHRLEDVRSTHSKERHNRDVLCIVEPQGTDGFIKLYNGLSRELASIGEGLQMMKAVIPVDQHARLES